VSYETLLVAHEKGVARITLNRAEVRKALSGRALAQGDHR
jgi:enoyl-CoA hydratase/carnithine racemase